MGEISKTEKRSVLKQEENCMSSPLLQPADDGSAMQEYATDEQLKEALEAHEKSGDALLQLIKRNRGARSNEYPTRNELQKFLEAKKRSGKAAILDLLNRKSSGEAIGKRMSNPNTPPEKNSH